jgi:hypothetical protein
MQEICENFLSECLSALFQLLLSMLLIIQLFNLLKIFLDLLGLSETGLLIIIIYFDTDVQNFIVIDYRRPQGLHADLKVLGVQFQYHLHFVRGP